MLRNFDTELDQEGLSSKVVSTKVHVTETVTATPARPSVRRGYVALPDSEWGWDDLRDYVVAEIEARFGVFPRDERKEYGVFNAFLGRWGERAAPIARYAFEVCDGRWAGAPISVSRFCKGSDAFFAVPIAERL